MADLYRGYVPSNVSRDAKYSIRRDLDDGEMKVHLLFRSGHRERALLSTDLHLPLVQMVNDVKTEVQGREGGVFYLNEWGHVLVKTGNGDCYYAGTYPDPMAFFLGEREVSANPPAGLQPGELWPGPHAGIRYKLTANGSDISFELEEAPRRYSIHFLTDHGRKEDVRALAERLSRHTNQHGGRLYINEARQFFAPRPSDDGDLEYVYLGALYPSDPWFPEPPVPF
jgi:hypothetical protein